MRVGVIGTGRLGREHARILKTILGDENVVCFDAMPERSNSVASELGISSAASLEELLDRIDAVSIVVPTSKHAGVALSAVEHGKDIFIEKPISRTSDEARVLIERARAAGCILQVGHVERFNPAFEWALPRIDSPSFIEAERLGPFTPRGTDVSVVMDLMVHDLDLLLMVTGRWPVEIRAKGARILSDDLDIVNARLDFPDGCVANVTASRVSMESSRKFRVFSRNSYISVDLKAGRVKHLRKGDRFDDLLHRIKSSGPLEEGIPLTDLLDFEEVEVGGDEPLRRELEKFCEAVEMRRTPPVSGEDGLRALRLAEEILSRMSVEPSV